MRMVNKPLALITGIAGFCGRHLAAFLSNGGYTVVGFDRQDWSTPGVTVYQGDIADTAWLQRLVGAVQPQVIFHLAALTDPRAGYEELHRVNALGTLAFLNIVRETCAQALILITSTSAVYGQVPPEDIPIDENRAFRPANAYAVSKIAQEMVAYQQFAEHGLRVIRTRAFNITGPGESAYFVTSAFARQIADIEAGRREPVLQVGNLETVRDLTDVRDVVRAYSLLAEYGEPGAVYNVCSERGTPIRDLLETLLNLSRVRGISVQTDPIRLQPADVPIQVGDATRLHRVTSWTPNIALQQTLQDTLDSWRRRIQEEI
jgi:GDP-4-dehydro-6-deoxy-D-mannose reductase